MVNSTVDYDKITKLDADISASPMATVMHDGDTKLVARTVAPRLGFVPRKLPPTPAKTNVLCNSNTAAAVDNMCD